MTRTVRAVGYVRVSTIEQADSGLGMEAQRATIDREVDRREWSLCDVYVDAGASGKSLVGRPGLAVALDVLDGRGADVLVVAKLDRLSRSLLDFASLMDRAQRRGWSVVALDLGVDTTTPAGEMMVNVLAAFAQYERRIIGQRTKEAMAQAKARGVHCGRRREVADEVVQRVQALRAAGATLAAIAQTLQDEGVPTARGGRWQASTVHRLLTKP